MSFLTITKTGLKVDERSSQQGQGGEAGSSSRQKNLFQKFFSSGDKFERAPEGVVVAEAYRDKIVKPVSYHDALEEIAQFDFSEDVKG